MKKLKKADRKITGNRKKDDSTDVAGNIDFINNASLIKELVNFSLKIRSLFLIEYVTEKLTQSNLFYSQLFNYRFFIITTVISVFCIANNIRKRYSFSVAHKNGNRV